MTQSMVSTGPDVHAEETFPAPGWYPHQAEWVRDPYGSNNAAYNYALPLRMRGPLSREALQSSFDEIVRRHAVLRSIFRIENGRVMQVVIPPYRVPIHEMDLRVLGPAAEAKARELAVEDAQRPFDLASEPLLRCTLLQLAADDHVLLLTTHHNVCDDWSTGILLRELSQLYAGQSLPPVASTYGEYARQLARQIQVGGMSSRIEFWKKNLAGGGDFHHLATDNPRPATPTYRGTHEVTNYSEELLSAIKSLAQREQASPFMVLLAAFQCLLQQYSGKDDIGVASCVANRNSTKIEELIGPFSNRVILRTDLSGNPTFREALRRSRNVSLDAYSYQDLPFGEVDARFQVLMILQNAPKESWQFPGLTVTNFGFDTGTTRYDLNVWLQFKNGIEVDLQYNADLFKAATMRKILDDYREILEAAVGNGEIHVNDFSPHPYPLPASGARELGAASAQRRVRGATLESELVALWESVLGRNVTAEDNFFDLGGDSITAVKLLARINAKFGKELSIKALFEAPTIRGLAALIESAPQPTEFADIVPIQPNGSRVPFFCIRAGPKFLPLAERLDPDQPFLGVELRPEVIAHLSVPYRLEEFARPLADAIVRYQAKGPYFVGGFCASGLAALEVARMLRERGEEVALLALFNSENPSLHEELAPKTEQLGRLANRAKWNRIREHVARIRKLSSKEARSYVMARVNTLRAEMQSILWQVGIDLRLRLKGRLNEINQILYTAVKGYAPQPYDGRVTHFCAARRNERHSDINGGWRGLMNGHFEAHEVPGGYWDILKAPGVDVLAVEFQNCLREARER